MPGFVLTPAQLLLGFVAAVFLYWAPGAALLALLAPREKLDWASRAGLAGGLSLSLYALLSLWSWTAGFAPGPLVAWIPGSIALAFLVWRGRHSMREALVSMRTPSLSGVTLVSLLALVVVSRWTAPLGMAAPAWGDSVQHTFIVQLLLDNGGLFQSWAPYAPMQSFTYHFGFHAAASASAWLTGQSAPDAVLIAGQIVNVLAVLALYPLAVRLAGGNRWAGVGAVLVGGLVSAMPAYYLNWGRYTQLSGQVILPAVLWALDVWWAERTRPSRRVLLLLAFLLAGLALTHYRIVLLALLGLLAWSIWGLWEWHREAGEWRRRAIGLAATCVVAVLLVAPWLLVVSSSLLLPVYRLMMGLDPGIFSIADITRDWSGAPLLWLLVVALGALLLGPLRRQRVVAVIGLWCLLCFLAANPFLLGLPGMGLITNFALMIALYIPAALVVGWLIGSLAHAIEYSRPALAVLAIAILVTGAVSLRDRLRDADPSFQLVAPEDLRAFAWIAEHTPRDARFLVNSFVAYGGSAVVGSDAGWWLPVYTRRSTTLPPLPYTMEQMPSEKARYDVFTLPTFLQRTKGAPWLFRRVMCWTGASYVFLGEKRGSVGTEGPPLIPENWLRDNPELELVFTSGRAQVWAFDRSRCPKAVLPWALP